MDSVFLPVRKLGYEGLSFEFLHNVMTPGLSKDIQCQTRHLYSHQELFIIIITIAINDFTVIVVKIISLNGVFYIMCNNITCICATTCH